MRLRTVFPVLALASNSFAGILHLDLYTESGEDGPTVDHRQEILTSVTDKAPWRQRDEGHLVPLVPGAKTGALPVDVEEGLTYALGPRFANVFIEAAVSEQNGTSATAQSCNALKCGGVAIRASPCIAAAIACKCIDPLLKCPVKPPELCACVNCLPKPIQDFLRKIGICADLAQYQSLISAAEDDVSDDYPGYVAYSTRSSNLLAYRGDISRATVAEAKEVASLGFCIGVPCDNCECCLGFCVLGKCVGACLD